MGGAHPFGFVFVVLRDSSWLAKKDGARRSVFRLLFFGSVAGRSTLSLSFDVS